MAQIARPRATVAGHLLSGIWSHSTILELPCQSLNQKETSAQFHPKMLSYS